uniref:Uncharacterized protein n=1 Tax=Medicago truncatula TaxID=3880 RepID=I3T8F1_MEDTR|nr:unknown [Medicago truncatula]
MYIRFHFDVNPQTSKTGILILCVNTKRGADIHAKNEFICVIMLISLHNFHANP